MYKEGLKTYFDDLASKKPAPGGGSGAALVGAAGAALLSMVANFTIGKEKYKDVESEIKQVLEVSEKYRLELQGLVDQDVTAYQGLSAAYKLPKESDEDKLKRTESIQHALIAALKVPLETARACFETAKLCKTLLDKGNVNLVSDVGVGVEFLASGYRAALLNVEINLSQIKDEILVAEVREEIEAKEKEIEATKENIVAEILKRIKK